MGVKDCSMSLFPKPCPREDFKCKRCLARQKNTGQAFEVDVGGVVLSPGIPPSFPAFVTKLYWDQVMFLVPEQEDVVATEIECEWGIWVLLDRGGSEVTLIFKRNRTVGFPTNGETLTQLGVSLYYYNQWRLVLDYSFAAKGTGILGVPGYINGYSVGAKALYTSGDNACFYPDPHLFTLQSQSSSFDINDEGGEDPEVFVPEFTFPETVPYRTVANDGFNA